MQLSRKMRLQRMAIVDRGNGEPRCYRLLEKLIRPQCFGQVAPITKHPTAAMNPDHEWRRSWCGRHPHVQLQRPISRRNRIGDAFVARAAVGQYPRLRGRQETSRSCPLRRRRWCHAHVKSDSSRDLIKYPNNHDRQADLQATTTCACGSTARFGLPSPHHVRRRSHLVLAVQRRPPGGHLPLAR
jgi:hypothetical protein